MKLKNQKTVLKWKKLAPQKTTMIQHDVNYPSWSRKPGKDYLREFIIVLFHINAVVPNLGLKRVKKEDTSSQSSNTILDLLPKHPPLL